MQLCSEINIIVGDDDDVKRTRRYCLHDCCIISYQYRNNGTGRSFAMHSVHTHILTELHNKLIRNFSCDCCYFNQFQSILQSNLINKKKKSFFLPFFFSIQTYFYVNIYYKHYKIIILMKSWQKHSEKSHFCSFFCGHVMF